MALVAAVLCANVWCWMVLVGPSAPLLAPVFFVLADRQQLLQQGADFVLLSLLYREDLQQHFNTR